MQTIACKFCGKKFRAFRQKRMVRGAKFNFRAVRNHVEDHHPYEFAAIQQWLGRDN